MTLLSRYILKRLLFSTFLLSTFLILAVWLTQSLRFLDMIVNRNVSLKGYFSLIGFLLPDLIAIILPICFFVSVLFVYNKYTQESELTVCRAIGLSDGDLAKPALILSFVCCIFVYIINLYVIPFSFKHFRDEEHTLRQQFSSTIIQEGRFNSFNNVVIYVKQRYRSGKIEGVFVYNSQKNPYTLLADEGKILMKDDTLHLFLKNGERQETDPKTGKLHVFRFEQLHYNLSDLIKEPSEERTVKPYEKNLADLLSPEEKLEAAMKVKYVAAAHQRILQPLFVLLDVMIALNFLLKGAFNRRGQQKRIIMAVFAAFSLHALMISLINMNAKWHFSILVGYILYGILFFGNGWMLLKKPR